MNSWTPIRSLGSSRSPWWPCPWPRGLPCPIAAGAQRADRRHAGCAGGDADELPAADRLLLAHTFPPSVESAAPRTRRPGSLVSGSWRALQVEKFPSGPISDEGRPVSSRALRSHRGAAVGRFGLVLSSEIRLLEAALLAWFRTFGRDLPWRKTSDPYSILVSEVMLQQTQVERVIPRYRRWLERWPTAEALAAALASGRHPRVAGARLQPASGQPPPRGAADRRAGLARRPDRTARRGGYTAAAIRNFAFGDAGAPGRHERAPRAGAHSVHASGPSARRPCSTSARPSVWLESRGAGSAPSPQTAPRAERATSRCASSRASRARSGSAVPRRSVQSRAARGPSPSSTPRPSPRSSETASFVSKPKSSRSLNEWAVHDASRGTPGRRARRPRRRRRA